MPSTFYNNSAISARCAAFVGIGLSTPERGLRIKVTDALSSNFSSNIVLSNYSLKGSGLTKRCNYGILEASFAFSSNRMPL